MIALGIDPGTRRVGFGVVRQEGNEARLIKADIVPVSSSNDVDALFEIKACIDGLIRRHKPDVIAVEKLFFSKNRTTAIAVAQARGVILLAAREGGVRIREYGPNEVKIGVTGYGAADKKAVLKMVRLILKKPALSVIDDASDALALAIIACGDRTYPHP
ncbi:MAG TPA: crossover junction endodeoxyribonuclease RuvC [Candidatus Paceibacterota bacterium]|nr:crossover junction endodeoxyribonuclease RuvC [Candidatus Paceibacterota bacterium]